MRQQRVFLSLDELALLALKSRVLLLAHLVERLAQVSDHMELVEQNRCLRGVASRRITKGFPHVHGELLIKRRSVFGTGHDSVLAKRTPQIGSSR